MAHADAACGGVRICNAVQNLPDEELNITTPSADVSVSNCSEKKAGFEGGGTPCNNWHPQLTSGMWLQFMSRNSFSSYRKTGFEFCLWLGIFLLDTAFRRTLGPTQSPIQWVLGALSLEVKRQRHKADHSPASSAEVEECVELYLYSPIRLHGVVLS
jgi:hypothetical protein